jgi:hypothetical protein
VYGQLDHARQRTVKFDHTRACSEAGSTAVDRSGDSPAGLQPRRSEDGGRKTEKESEFPPTSLFLLPPFETILAKKLGVSRTAVMEMAVRRLAEVETIP